MAGYYEEQEPNYQIPLLHHDLSVDELTTPPPVKPFEFTGLRAQIDELDRKSVV